MRRLARFACLSATAILAGLGTAVAPASADAGCIPSGTDATINAALNGAGAVATLCPGAVFSLSNTVRFKAPNQQLTTQGQPTDGTRALLKITNPSLTGAITAEGQSGAVIENIQVDGGGRELGNRQGSALVEIGGVASNQTVQHIAAGNTRGWPVLQLYEGGESGGVPLCQHDTVLDNDIGPTMSDNGFGSDGIMVACGNSVIERNTVRDATDTGIVIFGAAGSLIQGNTVVAQTRETPDGISMADYTPTNNYSGTRLDGNTVDAEGNFIRVGILVGPRAYGWCDSGLTVFGGTITNNTLQGQFMGYGIGVAGVSDFNISGNVDRSRHVGTVATPGCGGTQPPPATSPGFLYNPGYTSGSTLQPEFQVANVNDLTLKTSLPSILLLPAKPPTGCGQITDGQWLSPGHAVWSCDGRFQLALQGDGNLVLYEGTVPLWATNTYRQATAMAIMQADGNFVLYNTAGTGTYGTGTVVPGSWLALQNDGNLVIYSPTGAPLWTSNTGGH